jgi:hypothetical protein
MPKPFTKNDQRINRRGRPKKGTSLSDLLSQRLDEKDESGVLKRQTIADRLIEAAMNGDLMAVRYIFDRLDGKPFASLELKDNRVNQRLREILDNGN